MTLYEADRQFEELMDKVFYSLSPEKFAQFLDDISMIIADYEDMEEDEG